MMHPLAYFLSLSLIVTASASPTLSKELTEAPTPVATQAIQKHLLLHQVDLKLFQNLGFKPLIGKDLSSWKIHNPSDAVSYSLEDGVISGKAQNLKGNSFLYTSDKYADFLLYFEFRFDHMKGNSGLMYRSQYQGKNFTGLQYEMDNAVKVQDGVTRQWTGLLYAEKSGGWLYPNRDKAIGSRAIASLEWKNQLSAKGHQTLNSSGWNAAFIRVRGNEIQSWLNGELRTDFSSPDPDFAQQGAIALQMHGGKECAASWRNIYILPLSQ